MVNPKRESQAAPTAVADDGDEWETIPTGSLGEEWDFERNGALVGNFIGSREVETQKIESGRATAYQFAPVADPDAIVFVWGSAEIEAAFTSDLIRVGDKVRITYLGERAFTAADGKPRRIKQYKVEAAKRS